jgi:Ca-activated chloride channel family protein
MTAPTLKITPRRRALLLGHDNHLDVLVRVLGPEPPTGAPVRRKLNLALAIDRSGSMQGRPLEEAKRCAARIVEQLHTDDRVSVTTYDDQARVAVPATQLVDKATVLREIEAIRSGGATDLHAGWLAAAEQAARHITPGAVSRVLLLSDGCANRGVVDPATISERCSQMAEAGVSTSTYGLGTNFNEDLMLAMARAGHGNAYYGQTADDLMGPFQQEFDLLQALCARNLVLTLQPRPGVTCSIINDLSAVGDGWRLPDLAYGSEAWALVQLVVRRDVVAQAADHPLGLIRVRVRGGERDAEFELGPQALELQALPQAAFTVLAEDERVARRASEVRFAAFQRDAAGAARLGDWRRVDAILDEARREARGNAWLEDSLRALERYASERERERFAKEARFKAERMESRLTAHDEGDFMASMEMARPSFLRRRSEEGRTQDPSPGA